MNAAPITPIRSPSRGLSSGNGKGEQERGKKNRSGSEEENASMRGVQVPIGDGERERETRSSKRARRTHDGKELMKIISKLKVLGGLKKKKTHTRAHSR